MLSVKFRLGLLFFGIITFIPQVSSINGSRGSLLLSQRRKRHQSETRPLDAKKITVPIVENKKDSVVAEKVQTSAIVVHSLVDASFESVVVGYVARMSEKISSAKKEKNTLFSSLARFFSKDKESNLTKLYNTSMDKASPISHNAKKAFLIELYLQCIKTRSYQGYSKSMQAVLKYFEHFFGEQNKFISGSEQLREFVDNVVKQIQPPEKEQLQADGMGILQFLINALFQPKAKAEILPVVGIEVSFENSGIILKKSNGETVSELKTQDEVFWKSEIGGEIKQKDVLKVVDAIHSFTTDLLGTISPEILTKINVALILNSTSADTMTQTTSVLDVDKRELQLTLNLGPKLLAVLVDNEADKLAINLTGFLNIICFQILQVCFKNILNKSILNTSQDVKDATSPVASIVNFVISQVAFEVGLVSENKILLLPSLEKDLQNLIIKYKKLLLVNTDNLNQISLESKAVSAIDSVVENKSSS